MNRPTPRLAAAFAALLLPAAIRAGTVSGRVLDDGGNPVVGARVVWESHRSEEETLRDETLGVSPPPLGEVATDAEGRFKVALEKPGLLVSLRVLTASLPWALLSGPYESSGNTLLEDVQLPVPKKVSGRVGDEAGKPVAGARVRMGGGIGEEEVRLYAEASTGADGSFIIPNAPAESANLTVRARGLVPFSRFRPVSTTASEKLTLARGATLRGTVLDPEGKPAAGAIVLVGELAAETGATGVFRLEGVAAGARSVEAIWKDDFGARREGLRLRKGEEAELSLRLARTASITGTVLEEKTRRPIAGAAVSASTTLFRTMGSARDRKARTDARGRFRLAGLLPRRYSVAAEKEGYLASSIPGIVAGLGTPGSISVALQLAATVQGRVSTETGKAVPGARVRVAADPSFRAVLRGGASPLSLLSRSGALTGPDGTFRLKGLRPARNLTIEAVKGGYTTARRHGVSLKVGENAKNVDLVLRRGLEARGKVVDAAGQPVAGAEIRLSGREGGRQPSVRFMMRGLAREKLDAISGGDGGFRLTGLEAGEYVLSVTREGYAGREVHGLVVKAEGENLWASVVLSAGAPVAGAVRNAQGEPVAGAQIFCFGEGGISEDTVSDAEGRFRIGGLAPERPVNLSVRAEGYATLQRSVTPPSSDLTLVLKMSATLRGRVEDAATKRPLTDFSVGYSMPRGGPFRIVMGGAEDRTYQSADGTFELPDIPPGRWTVRASAPGYRTAELAGVELAEGDTKEGIVLSLEKGSTLSGRVLDPRRGAGVPNASVSWAPVTGDGGGRFPAVFARMSGGEGSTATDADGRFRFEGLPSGKVTLVASHPEFVDVTREIALEGDETLDLTLSIGGAIAGTVVGKDGRSPIAGARVSLDALGEGSFGGVGDTARSDGAGNFLFENLEAGRYRVGAEGDRGQAALREVVLAEEQRLEGLLIEMAGGATIRGTVAGLPPDRLSGIRVQANGTSYDDRAVTDDAGRFTLHDVPPGLLRLSASTSFMPGGRSTSKSVEVPDGAGEVSVEIVFEGASRLAGRVTRGDRPLPGLWISASPDPPSGARASGQTDEEGSYALEGLADGSYQVSVNGPGVNYRKTFEVSGDTAGDIALPNISLSGYVTDAATGDPLSEASVQAETGSETASFAIRRASTDSRGFYTLDDLDPGQYKVTARRPGYQLKEQAVTVGDASAELSVALSRGSGVVIRALDGLTGLPLRGLDVTAFTATGGVAYSGNVALDSKGEGEVASLGPGLYSVYCFSQGYAPRVVPSLQVPSAPVQLAMTPGGRVEARTDAPVTARMLDASGAMYLLSPWRLDGRITAAPPMAAWEHVAPGAYRLVVSTSGGEKSYDFTVSEGRTTTVELR